MTDERILQISNDISEGECTATGKELIEVVRYWQQLCDRWNDLHQDRINRITIALTEIVLEHAKQPHP